jgi:hypothetical protein
MVVISPTRLAVGMLAALFGSRSAERVLVFLLARGEGYATEIARFFRTDLYGVQKKLDGLEAGGILISRKVGRTRVYSFNPTYPLLNEVRALLRKALSFQPDRIQEQLMMTRKRPRRRGKPA